MGMELGALQSSSVNSAVKTWSAALGLARWHSQVERSEGAAQQSGAGEHKGPFSFSPLAVTHR